MTMTSPRQSLRALPLLLAFATMTQTLVSHDARADWPQFQGPNHNGAIEDVKIYRQWPKDGPKVLWTKKLDIGFGGPAIRDGKVFLMDRDFGKKDILRVLDLESGKELWTYSYDAEGRLPFAGSRATPLVDEETVVIVGGFGDVHGISRKTKKKLWSINFQKDFKAPLPRWGFPQSALGYKGMAIVAPMGPEVGLVAIDKATGKVKWKSEAIGGAAYASPMIHTLLGETGVMLITKLDDGSTGQVSFVNPDNGKLIWKYNGYFNKIAIPHQTKINDNTLFITGGYSNGSVMLRLHKKDGKVEFEELWRFKVDGSQIHPAHLYKGHLYANFNHNDNLRSNRGKDAPGMVCIDLDGNYKWKTKNDPDINRGGIIRLGDLMLALGGEDGKLHLIQPDPSGYKALASHQVFTNLKKRGNNIWAPLAFSDGLLVIRDQNEVKCLQIGPRSGPQ